MIFTLHHDILTLDELYLLNTTRVRIPSEIDSLQTILKRLYNIFLGIADIRNSRRRRKEEEKRFASISYTLYMISKRL